METPSVKISKTQFERCEPVGRELLRKAKEEKDSRKKWADNEVGQSAKDAATYLCGLGRGRVMFTIDPNDWERIFRRKK